MKICLDIISNTSGSHARPDAHYYCVTRDVVLDRRFPASRHEAGVGSIVMGLMEANQAAAYEAAEEASLPLGRDGQCAWTEQRTECLHYSRLEQ